MGTHRRLVPQRLTHTPDVGIQVDRRTIDATAIPLSKDAGADLFARYATQHRTAAKLVLPRVLGFSVDGSEADFRAAGQHMPFVRFAPGPEWS
jgi:hypothetical protein